jgi:nicotinamidase-related amidase
MEKIKNKKGKKKRMAILFSVLGVLVALVATYVITGLYVTLPTKGERIARYNDPKSALLVMDVQNDITRDKAYGNTEGFVESVNQSTAFAEENGMEIIYVKNIYGNNPVVLLLAGGKGKRGTEGVEFDSRLNVVNGNVFVKSRGDSFSSAEFENYLIAQKIDTLYIVGADAAGCVLRTAQGGKNRGYNVTIIKDAVTTAANDTKMKQVEEQYKKDGIITVTLNELRQ